MKVTIAVLTLLFGLVVSGHKHKVNRDFTKEQQASLPFNPKTDVSADAKKIVANLWIVFSVGNKSSCPVLLLSDLSAL